MQTPEWLQFSGSIASIIGVFTAAVAAWYAKHAKDIAAEAARAATLLGRIAELGDVIADTQELHALLARRHFEALGAKTTRLRGRIVRFKQEALGELAAEERAFLDVARLQLEKVGEVALSERSERRKVAQINKGVAKAEESLNQVYAIRRKRLGGHDDG